MNEMKKSRAWGLTPMRVQRRRRPDPIRIEGLSQDFIFIVLMFLISLCILKNSKYCPGM